MREIIGWGGGRKFAKEQQDLKKKKQFTNFLNVNGNWKHFVSVRDNQNVNEVSHYNDNLQ